MLQRYGILKILENPQSKAFITNNLTADVSVLALKYSGKVDFELADALKLIALYQKGRKKLPVFTDNLLAMTDRSYQQSTSEKVARFKAGFIKGEKLLDLSGGLGMDDIAFAEHFEKVVSLDVDEELNALVRYNLAKLGLAQVERRTADAHQLITDETFDWVYIDPDRRSDKGRHVSLDNLNPDIRELIPHYLAQGSKLAIKLSPLFEVKEVRKAFPRCNAVHVISEYGEVKEILLLFLHSDEFLVYAQDIGPRGFAFSATAEQWDHPVALADQLKKVLYLPNAALIKSRLTDYYLSEMGLERLGEFAIYQSDDKHLIVGCRVLEVIYSANSGVKAIKKMIKSSGIKQFNILLKGTSEKPQQLARKLAVVEGGDHYLIVLQSPFNVACIARLLS